MPVGGLLGDETHSLAQQAQQVVLIASGYQIVGFGCQLDSIDELSFGLGREDGLIGVSHSGLGKEDELRGGLDFGMVHELVDELAEALHRVRILEHFVPGSFLYSVGDPHVFVVARRGQHGAGDVEGPHIGGSFVRVSLELWHPSFQN